MRITGGIFRSRTLIAPHGQKTRPTSDRVREALFSLVAARTELEGARVLDLYAGTGALALEALSRGAANATLVERDRNALVALKKNVSALEVQARVEVLACDVERAVRTLAERTMSFDLVFADPPYADVPSGAFARAIRPLLDAPLASPSGLLVLEHASRDAPPPLFPTQISQSRVYGDTTLTLYAFA